LHDNSKVNWLENFPDENHCLFRLWVCVIVRDYSQRYCKLWN
jgi:hypothetical protein